MSFFILMRPKKFGQIVIKRPGSRIIRATGRLILFYQLLQDQENNENTSTGAELPWWKFVD